MKVTYFGHSCFLVTAGGKNILFDPFITPNELAKDIDVDQIQADYIFLSHAHYDHITDVVRIAKNTGAMVLGNFEIYNWLLKSGIENSFPINPGGKKELEFGSVKCVVAQHSSSFSDGSYGGIACGFVLTTPDGNFYYSGDTALTNDMAIIPKFTKLDFAVFPIGDGLTMGIEEAVEASKIVGVAKILGVHYDTFGFIVMDHQKATQSFNEAGLQLYLPAIGSTIAL
ncbi:MAG: metal-dependent hydrolase [Flavobacterium circumlabens]|uniref:L-ascorbate metabolism protein UlaG (Beta-lactamase superfamily) n=1 Tax=Flavobacterium circumlabens TaxID=2133765 RepID=A0A4Y7UAU6_9FLAO|nr:metal-dependent hydrolase [Flavobacterium circumlabens]TCN55642.1 L-ascorbate metabolism protein UlaG (beta-lactamase superfamily) [Flavobacterium circumlabens]TEB42959.1 metal-dependent hydrolase [Flavobacterium circumlabens]